MTTPIEELPSSRPSRNTLLLALLLLAATLPYASALGMGFVYDDHVQIEENPHLHVWPGVVRVLTSDVWSMTDVDTLSNYYRPFMWLAYKAVFVVVGAAPWAFHFVNLALHAGVVMLILALSRKLWNDESIAVFAAFLFAVHPVHVEPIAWIGALPDLAYAFCFLASFYFYLEDKPEDELENKPRILNAVVTPLLYGAALLWKESAFVFLPMVVAYDAIVRKRISVRRYASLIIVTLGYVVVRTAVLGGFAPKIIRPGIPLHEQALTAVSNLAFYLAKLVVPANLSLHYPVEIVRGITLPIIAVALVVGIVAWKFRGRTAFAFLWILVPLVPTLAVTRVAHPLADRNLYLASLGFCWLAAWTIQRLRSVSSLSNSTSLARPAALALFGVLLTSYIAVSGMRVRDWRSDMALLERAQKIHPNSDPVRLLLADALNGKGLNAEALVPLDEILKGNPTHLEALLSKAETQLFLRDWPEMTATCARAFAVAPDTPRCHLYSGLFEQENRKFQEAWIHFEQAYAGNSRLWQAPFYQGLIAFAAGDLPTAAEKFSVALNLHPTAQVLNNLGSVYLRMGDNSKAISAYESALRLDPGYVPAKRNLEALRREK